MDIVYDSIKTEFLDLLLSISDIDSLNNRVLDFFCDKFKLSNCAMGINNYVKHKVTNSALIEVYTVVQKNILRNIENTRAPFVVKNLASDVLFAEIKDVEKLPQQVVALPLLSNKELLGCVICYSEFSIEPKFELLFWLCNKVAIALKRINAFSAVEHSALTDGLTGLYNRTYFEAVGSNEIFKARRDKFPTSVIMFDIDDFKLFNDMNGHLAGDSLLKDLGHFLSAEMPEDYVICRYGGEEFIVLLAETKSDVALDFAEKIRAGIAGSFNVSVSVGVVTCVNSSVDLQSMIKEADIALYKAKHLGKNRACQRIIVDKSLGVIDAEDAGDVGKTR